MRGHVRRAIEAMRSVDRRLSRRRDRRRILFNARTPMNYAMVAPVHRAMGSDPRVEFYFTASEAPGRATAILREAGADARIISPRRASLMRFDAYIAADLLWLALPRGTRRVQMFHGVAGKYAHDYDRPTTSMRQWHRHFFVNQRRLRNFIEAGAIEADGASARLIGMPKVDCLVDGSLNRDAAVAALGLDPSRPTVLYAPTWSAASSINLLGMEFIERLVAGPWNTVVKLHDRLRDERPFYSGGLDWGSRVAPALQGPHAVLASGANICPCLAASDVMITDHSSAGFEYLLCDRPLVRIHCPQLIRDANIHADYVALLASVSESVTTVAETVAAVERGLAAPDALGGIRRTVAADMFYRPGGATARAIRGLYEA